MNKYLFSISLWNIILLGGYFHGRNHLTFGVDVEKIRWLGVLQVTLFSYLDISLIVLCMVDSSIRFQISTKHCFLVAYLPWSYCFHVAALI